MKKIIAAVGRHERGTSYFATLLMSLPNDLCACYFAVSFLCWSCQCAFTKETVLFIFVSATARGEHSRICQVTKWMKQHINKLIDVSNIPWIVKLIWGKVKVQWGIERYLKLCPLVAFCAYVWALYFVSENCLCRIRNHYDN